MDSINDSFWIEECDLNHPLPGLRTVLNRLLHWMNFLNGYEIKQVIRETGKEIFHMDPKMSSDSYVT